MPKLHAVSNIEINKLFEKSPNWGGCWARNDLPKKIIEDKIYIINLDEKGNAGTHWVLLSNIDNCRILYFDSFGLPYPPQDVLKFINTTQKSKNKVLISNDLQLQNLTSSSCGWFCAMVCNELMKGRKFCAIILDSYNKKTSENEADLRRYFGRG